MHDRITTPLAASLLFAVAGSACFANELHRTALEVDGYATPHGYVYINQGTGERIVSHEATETTALRGAAWSWDNSVIDPCAPTPETPLSVAIFTGVMDDEAGDLGTANAVNYWSDWFKAPGDTIISGMTIGYFTQVIDPGENGVEDHELLFVLTERDSVMQQSNSIAHSPVLLANLVGAEDDGADGAAVAGDGIIDFAEGNYWVYFIDFASFDTPTDIEVADTNGVSDGAFGSDSTFSGVPAYNFTGSYGAYGFDEDLFYCGYTIGFRQPDVAEGNGLIDRFPELAGSGIENPDGLDIPSLANIVPAGLPLLAPSTNTASYDNEEFFWPGTPDYEIQAGDPIGTVDAFGLYDATGESTGTFFFGGFECDPNAVAAPFYLNPWSTPDIRFNVDALGPECLACNPVSCFAEPFDIIDLADINAFIVGFLAQDPISDIGITGNLPGSDGLYDLNDLNVFILSFLAGCP